MNEIQTQATKSLTTQYRLAIGVMLLITIIGGGLLIYQYKKNEGIGEIVNLSGMQRMLGHRIPLFASMGLEENDLSLRKKNLKHLDDTIHKMASNLNILTKGTPSLGMIPALSSAELEALYFTEPTMLSERVESFLNTARNVKNLITQKHRNILSKSGESLLNTQLGSLREQGTGELLELLNDAAQQHASFVEISLAQKEHYEIIFVILLLTALLLEILFIFRPMVQKMNRQMGLIEAQGGNVERRFTEYLLNAIDTPIFVKDEKHRYIAVNRAFCEFIGRDKGALIGEDDRAILPKEQVDIFWEKDDLVIDRQVIDINEEQVTSAKKGVITVITTKAPITLPNNARGLVGVVHDIEERKQAEEELEKHRDRLEELVTERTAELEIAVKEAEEANRLKSDFLATISHEIRTPMNGVLGMAELIQGATPSPQINGFAGTIINSGEALLHIINDILDFSKIEAGRIEICPEPFDMLEVLDDLATLYAPKARDKTVELVVRYVPGSEQFVIADPLRIRQILSNFVGNAIKFTENGHILISVEELNKNHDHDHITLRFAVKDTGPGIPKEAQQHIFDKFLQADSTTTRTHGGTGLGLAICKSLVELMGGEITLESAVGSGSTFAFTITVPRNKDATTKLKHPTVIKGVRVLTVDDLPIVSQLVSEKLNEAGMQCDKAQSGEEALNKILKAKQEGNPYQMVVMDYLMPNMNGEMLASAINDYSELRKTCLVMLTGAGSPLADDEFIEKGFSAYIPKPVGGNTIIKHVSHIWSKYKDGYRGRLIELEHDNTAQNDEDQIISIPNAHLLVAEDNLVNQVFIREILEDMQANFTIVPDGKQALEAIKNNRFSLVLMDCLMPQMDGFEATGAIRDYESGAEMKPTPIIALTANAMKGDREKCLDAGMDDYLTKPVRSKEIKQMIAKWLPDELIISTSCTSNAEEEEVEEPVTQETKPIKLQNVPEILLDEDMVEQARAILKNKYATMISTYLENAKQNITAIETANNAEDISGMIRPAHSLKSSSKQMGAIAISDCAKEIELLAKTQEEICEHGICVFTELVKTLHQLLEETERAFNNYAA